MIIEVDAATLVILIASSSLGAWLGAGGEALTLRGMPLVLATLGNFMPGALMTLAPERLPAA